jgi:NAD-dependent DNA ligase
MTGPTPEAWLELDEGEQAEAVLRYHKRHRTRAGSMRLHAFIHATVETQLAERHAAATAALERLLREGLDRHEAIHAIGSVVAEQIHGAMQGTAFDASEYEHRLNRLDAASWRRMAEEE